MYISTVPQGVTVIPSPSWRDGEIPQKCGQYLSCYFATMSTIRNGAYKTSEAVKKVNDRDGIPDFDRFNLYAKSQRMTTSRVDEKCLLRAWPVCSYVIVDSLIQTLQPTD